ncbi:PREDICTED: uncharacterized protein LOC106102455 [Papilio polytes]|uniref:uncharacterized protein LOC106102455 n=1 Tax=Papilio polytes TaxID=76194 RepID=UPI000675C49A|nr:PREDICTED: uncharacterized protein LOC106102455 [Papilio polytes]XP_013137395.1 PREDICTED: uncharacterized protein LOC106102455 [Papilio polytes]XP_013137397.1 PREDICTED: uncharacterized protein LOC106102455 [Papilio polytes]
MEVLGFIQEMLHSVAEYAASYRLGQSMLRQADRLLWTIEKSARWAVPPPLDQDERPQPELIRPLPWVFFLMLLVVLRVTRESISLINLVLGKPPLRSADVVTYIQGKRRYLRTLKYQGSRALRARGPAQPTSWCSSVQSLFEFTMCFRRRHNYDNNNTTRVSNNDEVLVVKRNKHGRQEASPVATTSDTMERLIEKMMVELQADSEDDSSYTLTNPMSAKSDQSADDADSEQEVVQNDVSGEIKYQNDSCQIHSSDENNIDNNHRDNAINEDRCEEMSAKDESFRLIQSEKSFQHNNKAGQVLHKPGMANGKKVCSTPSTDKDCSVKSPNKSPGKS